MGLKFYTNPMSRGRIVRWMLEEVGVPYETIYLSYGGTMKEEAYLAVNPMGKVPAIEHNGTVVTECAAICAYLADSFPESNLAPKPDQRGAYYRWLFFTAGPVESAVTNKTLQVSTDGNEQMTGYGNFDLAYNTLKAAIAARPYICGDTFSAADVYIGSQIGWGLQFGTLPASPELVAYDQRVHDRPAYRRATALDDAAMAEYGPKMPD